MAETTAQDLAARVQHGARTGTNELQQMTSPRLPFRESPEMNFVFSGVLGLSSSGGSTAGECYYAADHIRDGDTGSWVASFGALAAHVENLARRALDAGHPATARDLLLRATSYAVAAAHYTRPGDAQYHPLWEQSVNCFREAIPHLEIPTEAVRIPYLGRHLPGYFIRGSRERQGPTLLAMTGFDATAELLYLIVGAQVARRGYNVLLFEGPGQRGVLRMYPDLPFRPDYDVPIGAVLDNVLNRPEVDPARVALLGFSFGGHLILRAAARDRRIKALIADPPTPDFGVLMRNSFPSFLQHLPRPIMDRVTRMGMKRMPSTDLVRAENAYAAHGVSTASAFLEAMDRYRFTEPEAIACPTLCLVSEGEGASAVAQALDFYEALTCPKRMRVFTALDGAEAHCQLDNPLAMNHAICDWLDERFM